MKTKEVLKNVPIIYKSENYDEDQNILHLSEDTRDISEDSCFICLKGNKFDSHDLINSISIKPKLIISEKQIETDIPYVIVENTLKILPLICFNFYEDPSSQMNVIGVTGTDGKTTTSYIIKQLIDFFNDCAYVGTNGRCYKPVGIALEEILEDKLDINITP